MALETTNQKVYSKLHFDTHEYELLGSSEDSKLWVQKNLQRRIIQIHHLFTTQTSTLTMFKLDCDSQLNNYPLPRLWSLHELNVCATKNIGNLAGMDSFDKFTCRINLSSAVRHILRTSAAERLAAPLPTHGGSKLNLYDSSLIWSSRYVRQPRSQSISWNPNLGYYNSIFCKHDATIMRSWWSVLPLSGTSSFLVGNLDNSSLLLLFFVAWKHGANTERCHNKWPWRPQIKKSIRNFILTRMSMSCLDRARTANCGYRKIYNDESFKSITCSQLKHRPWRCSSWIVTPNSIITPYRVFDLFMSWMSVQQRILGIWREWIPLTNSHVA